MIHRLSSLKTAYQVIGLKATAFALFAWNNALSKCLTSGVYLTASGAYLSVHAVLFYQYLLALFILLGLNHLRGIPLLTAQLRHPWLHLCRAITTIIALILLHNAFKHLPLLQATGFNLFSPFISLLMAVLIFKENLCLYKITALGLSILGYLLLLSPGTTTSTNVGFYELILPTLSVFMFQLNTMATKLLTQANESQQNLLLTTVAAVPLALCVDVCYFSPQSPSWQQWLLLLIMGANMLIALYSINKALAMADISFLLPLAFIKQVFVSFFGFLYFTEIPSLSHGIAIVLGIGAVQLLGSTRSHMPPQPDDTTTLPQKKRRLNPLI